MVQELKLLEKYVVMKITHINSVNSDKRCSSHPHNIYFEILAETGLIGMIFFIFNVIFIKKTKITKLNFMKTNPRSIRFNNYIFWPIQSTGSLFSTWNGFLFTIFFICLLFIKKILL